MKTLILAAVLTLGAGSVAVAADAPTTQPAAAPINRKCPIGGEDIDPKVTIVYDGKVIGFCCKDCIEEFQKNPDKYMKKLK